MAPLFNAKAAKWVSGRKNIFPRLQQAIGTGNRVIWMHCSSLGEFEQGRPVLEALKEKHPGHRILLTFFSPSGYEIRKDYQGADWVFYLPMDGPRNAGKFLDIVQPELVIFVKYEFWFYYLKKVAYRNIPFLLISARFYEGAFFFRWYGSIGRKMLSRFDHIFIQDAFSMQLLQTHGLASNASVCGDTRFDRVLKIASEAGSIPGLDAFVKDHFVVVAGSTWPDDEAILANAVKTLKVPPVKLILAPHEISEQHLRSIETLFPEAVRFSALNEAGYAAPVLIIDNIGMLSRLYKYADITYVGGGYNRSGIHNVLEAAVYDKIVLFGPNHESFNEAVALVKAGGAFSVTASDHPDVQLKALIFRFAKDNKLCRDWGMIAGEFVRTQSGATEKILQYIQEKRLLTS